MELVGKDKVNKLLSFWRLDQTNEPLFLELLSSIQLSESYELIKILNDDSILTNFTSVGVHASFLQLLVTSKNIEEAKVYLNKYQQYLSHWCGYFHALIAFTEHDFDTVISHLETQQGTETSNESVLLLARAYFMKGLINDAISTLAPYISDQENTDVIGLYALCQFDIGNYQISSDLAQVALEKHSYNLDATLTLASYYSIIQDLTLAEKYIERCLELNPLLGRALSLKGQLAMYTGDFSSALVALKAATKTMPNHIGTWHLLAWTLLFNNHLADASSAFNKALELNPAFSESHGGIALVQIQNNAIEDARNSIKRALRLDSNCFTAKFAQSLIYELEGKDNEARELVESILDSNSHITSVSYKQLVQNALLNMDNKN